jgi:NADPH-dependent curcumin reductase CurA
MRGSVIGVVTASKSKAFSVGSYAIGNAGWAEYAIMKEKDIEKVEIPRNGKVTDALGVLGKLRSAPCRITPPCSPFPPHSPQV